MARLPIGARSAVRSFAFYFGNGTLAPDVLSGVDYLNTGDPGFGSMIEMAFAIFTNNLELDDEGQPHNESHATDRAASYIRSYCDPEYEIEPPLASWETELH